MIALNIDTSLKENYLALRKMTWGIWHFFARALSLKIGTLMTSFCLKLKICELKFTVELCVMAMKNGAKFKKELTCQFKIDMKNLTNLAQALENLKNFYFNKEMLLTKTYNAWAKKSAEKLCLMALNIDAKYEGKLTCVFKNDIRNIANFHQSTFERLKIRTLMGFFYPK